MLNKNAVRTSNLAHVTLVFDTPQRQACKVSWKCCRGFRNWKTWQTEKRKEGRTDRQRQTERPRRCVYKSSSLKQRRQERNGGVTVFLYDLLRHVNPHTMWDTHSRPCVKSQNAFPLRTVDIRWYFVTVIFFRPVTSRRFVFQTAASKSPCLFRYQSLNSACILAHTPTGTAF